MDPKELRDLSISELNDKHKQFKEELFNLRFQNAIGQLNSGVLERSKRQLPAYLR